MTGSCVALRISPTRKTNSIPTRISGSSSPARADTSSTLSSVSVSSPRYKSAPISGLYCASRRRQVRASGLQEAAKTGGEICETSPEDASRTGASLSGESASMACRKRKYSSAPRHGACRANRSSGSPAFFRTCSTQKPIAER
ncbi:MAG: hypothetical protein SO081_08980 [Oscillospiraceae bacterium]|nr:hypothetical protein [Oscillospiraceae bacterium]